MIPLHIADTLTGETSIIQSQSEIYRLDHRKRSSSSHIVSRNSYYINQWIIEYPFNSFSSCSSIKYNILWKPSLSFEPLNLLVHPCILNLESLCQSAVIKLILYLWVLCKRMSEFHNIWPFKVKAILVYSQNMVHLISLECYTTLFPNISQHFFHDFNLHSASFFFTFLSLFSFVFNNQGAEHSTNKTTTQYGLFWGHIFQYLVNWFEFAMLSQQFYYWKRRNNIVLFFMYV